MNVPTRAAMRGSAAKLLNPPVAIGELAAGLLLGPSVLGSLAPAAHGWLFPDDPLQRSLLAGPAWTREPTFLPAWILGMVTIGAGWFLLQPGMGAGWAASKRANAWQVRFLNVVSHTVFAAGLYGTALLLR